MAARRRAGLRGPRAENEDVRDAGSHTVVCGTIRAQRRPALHARWPSGANARRVFRGHRAAPTAAARTRYTAAAVFRRMTGTPDIRVTPIGYVHSSRRDLEDDNWDSVKSRIELTDAFGSEAFDGIEEFSHAEIVFVFDR